MMFEGEFNYGEAFGTGVLYRPNGDVVVGQFHGLVPTGECLMLGHSGSWSIGTTTVTHCRGDDCNSTRRRAFLDLGWSSTPPDTHCIGVASWRGTFMASGCSRTLEATRRCSASLPMEKQRDRVGTAMSLCHSCSYSTAQQVWRGEGVLLRRPHGWDDGADVDGVAGSRSRNLTHDRTAKSWMYRLPL